jgi:transposase
MEVLMAYSEQFRKEVMEYIDGFYSQDYVAKLFGLSPKTVWNWVQQRKEQGHLGPKKSADRAPRKLPKNALLQYIRDNPDAFLREIADHFKCAKSSVERRLKKLGVSYKKNSAVQGKRREKAQRIC